MDNPIIDPSTLTEEQRKRIKDMYQGDILNLEDAEMGYKWLLTGAKLRLERLFGKDFFNEKGE